jgi:DNA-binding transcriptional MerR regulator
MKKLLIVLASIFALIFLFWLAANLLGKHIYSRTDCRRFNIDNIELRTGIDIPQIKEAKTKCKSDSKVKTASFILNLTPTELDSYLIKNQFTKESDLYINKGQRKDTQWEAILNPENMELKVKIEYY